MPRVQVISWKQKKRKDPNPNKPRKPYIHPPTHRRENISAIVGASKEVHTKNIKMGGDVL